MSNGHQVTLRFTCTDPLLELKSVWRAQLGPGPVENGMTIENKSGAEVTFGPGISTARIALVADGPVTLLRADKTAVGQGKVHQDVIVTNAQFATGTDIIPLILLGVGSTHGAYLGFEWELGGFKVSSQADPLPGGIKYPSSRNSSPALPSAKQSPGIPARA